MSTVVPIENLNKLTLEELQAIAKATAAEISELQTYRLAVLDAFSTRQSIENATASVKKLSPAHRQILMKALENQQADETSDGESQ